MICGIISEFNPFHNGHHYLVEQIRAKFPASSIIAVMSGSFTQRGEPAIFDKWLRAKMAVAGGVDLVLELPAAFALQSAEGFASGGIDLLKKLKIVDTLAFGSESANLPALEKTADFLLTVNPKTLFSQQADRKKNYAALLLQAAVQQIPECATLLRTPNDILAIEYLKAIKRQKADLQPFCVQRQGADHNALLPVGKIASATALRQIWRKEEAATSIAAFLPDAVQQVLPQDLLAADFTRLLPLLLFHLRCSEKNSFKAFTGLDNGLAERLHQSAKTATTLQDLLAKSKTKSCHYSRLQRALCHILLDLRNDDVQCFQRTGALYARVLAASGVGLILLRELKKAASIPLITKITSILPEQLYLQQNDLLPLQRLLRFDLRATELQALCYERPLPQGRDYLISPYFAKEKGL